MKPLMQLGAITDKILMKIKADFLVMQGLRGRFINLRESTKRRKQIEVQLENLNMRKYYERFEAIKGEINEAKQRGLSPGEIGLWKSWLGILKEEKSANNKEYLHIIEDDCILDISIGKLIKAGASIFTKYDIIGTDMYVNPSIYRALSEKCRENKIKSNVEIIGIYTGCTSSMLIGGNSIDKVYRNIEEEFNKGDKLIPIDNYLRRCTKMGSLNIGITVPFLTSVPQESISNSTIQSCEDENKAISLTQELCTLLRRDLCINTKKKEDVKMLVEIYSELVRIKEKRAVKRTDMEIIIEKILSNIDEEGLLKYKLRPNLKGEHGNPQE